MKPETHPTPPSSRRDFLRRAGKQAAQEAVDIGTKIVPGAALAKRFLAGPTETGEPDDDLPALDLSHPTGSDTGADVPEPPMPSPLTSPLGWLAAWRKRRE